MALDDRSSRQREGQVNEEQEEQQVLIGKLAELTGTSTRALRHYEDRSLLIPVRDRNGYRIYSGSDVARVEQIRTMIGAGLGTQTIGRFLDCARSGEHGVTLDMCPDLRAELDALAKTLDAKQAALRATEQRLSALSSPC
ncbi:MerR family transcriptional regulator [Streptomyces sp. NPDC094034]|uniref:MerR family transcriptional regulator n=1 Tax=Streptomyces sp. NPDC094034 TaxID=3155309 RepID=UPI00331CEA21